MTDKIKELEKRKYTRMVSGVYKGEMMDTERFGLTPEEIAKHGDFDKYIPFGIFSLLQDQIAKVLSMFEPVELEALGNEEIEKWLFNRLGEGNVFEQFNRSFCTDLSQVTIKKNQKGQLYRVKEGEGNEKNSQDM